MSRLTASRAAFDLISSFEGFRTRAAMTPNGQWTLGFGHVATAREGLSVTRAEAEDLLRWDLLPIEDYVRTSALTPLTQSQFDALVSFAFNIGLENFKSSDTLKFLNQGQPIAAALAMQAWRRARMNDRVLTIDALVRRRAAEMALFLEPSGPRPAAPSSILQPQIDYSAALLSQAADVTHFAAGLDEAGGTVGAPIAPVAPAPAPTLFQGEVDDAAKPVPSASAIAEAVETLVLRDPELAATTPEVTDRDGVAAAPLVNSELADNVQIPQSGLTPFPGDGDTAGRLPHAANSKSEEAYFPANDGRDPPILASTMDGSSPAAAPVPEAFEPAPAEQVDTLPAARTGWLWGGLSLGGALLAGGAWLLHRAGGISLPLQGPVQDPVTLVALLAVALGFVVTVTTAFALARQPGD